MTTAFRLPRHHCYDFMTHLNCASQILIMRQPAPRGNINYTSPLKIKIFWAMHNEVIYGSTVSNHNTTTALMKAELLVGSIYLYIYIYIYAQSSICYLSLSSIQHEQLPSFYWLPKLHKKPYGSRFIAASNTCTTKQLSSLLTSCFKTILIHYKQYCDGTVKPLILACH